MKRILISVLLFVTLSAYAELVIETVAETESGTEYLMSSNMVVPKAEGNRHYRAIRDWIEKGNHPSPYVEQEKPKQMPTPEQREIADLKARIAELETKAATIEQRVKELETKITTETRK